MTIYEQIDEIAEARCKRLGLPAELVAQRAVHYIDTGKCERPQQAVQWAIQDYWDTENDQPIRPIIEGQL